MAEQRIIITIDEQGKISASTEGIKGAACLEELEALLDEVEAVQKIQKTDEFDQQEQQRQQNLLKIKKT